MEKQGFMAKITDAFNKMSKKKKYIVIGVGAIIIIILFSLLFGGSSDSTPEVKEEKVVVLKAAQTEIKGDLKGCYEVVDKNYKVKFAQKSYENDVITVELKRTSKDLPYDRNDVTIFPEAKESSANNCAGFGIEILNADGDVIDKQTANATPYSWDEMKEALLLLQDETTTIAFHFDNLSEATSFRITSLVQKNEKIIEEEIEEEIETSVTETDLFDDAFDIYDKALDDAFDIYDEDDLDDLKTATKAAKSAIKLGGALLDLAL